MESYSLNGCQVGGFLLHYHPKSVKREQRDQARHFKMKKKKKIKMRGFPEA
jgi:hypothetical protein